MLFHPVSCVTFETGSFKDLLPWKDNMASYWLDSKNLYIKKIITILEMSLIFLIGRSIVCHDALSFETSTNHFVQRIEVWQQMNMSNQGVAQTFLTFFPREVQFALILQFFLHEICLIIFWREILKKTLKLLPKMLLVETLCKLVQIFPPKVLVYTRKIFLTTFLTNVIKLWLKRVGDKKLCLIVYWILQNNKRWYKNWSLFID